MSIGLQVLRAAIDNQSRDLIRGLNERFFTEDELPAWNFLTSYMDRYGGFPTLEICQQNGIVLPAADGPVGYFRDQLRNRTVYNVYHREQQALMQMLHSGDMDAFVARLDQMLAEMRTVSTRRDTYTMQEALQLVLEDFREAQRSTGLRGITYGFPTLDDLTGGAIRGDVATVVARPGQGKSFLIAYMACAAWQAGHPIVLVSMEMTVIEFARRILAMGSGVGADLIQRGTVSMWGQERVVAAVERSADFPPFTIMVGDLSKSVRDVSALIYEHDPAAVYLDASYLIQPTDRRGITRQFELVSKTIHEIKSLSIEADKPIIQTVQFNRSQKADEEMTIDNIASTDDIGRLSGLVLGLRKGSAPHENTRRKIAVLKNRNGIDNVSFEIRFEHQPFCMDEVEEGEGGGDGDEWDGIQGPAPAQTEWSAV